MREARHDQAQRRARCGDFPAVQTANSMSRRAATKSPTTARYAADAAVSESKRGRGRGVARADSESTRRPRAPPHRRNGSHPATHPAFDQRAHDGTGPQLSYHERRAQAEREPACLRPLVARDRTPDVEEEIATHEVGPAGCDELCDRPDRGAPGRGSRCLRMARCLRRVPCNRSSRGRYRAEASTRTCWRANRV